MKWMGKQRENEKKRLRLRFKGEGFQEVEHIPLPPIIMEVKNGYISNSTYLSNIAIFHLHDYGRKSTMIFMIFQCTNSIQFLSEPSTITCDHPPQPVTIHHNLWPSTTTCDHPPQPVTTHHNLWPFTAKVTSGSIATVFNQICLHITRRDIFRKHHLSFIGRNIMATSKLWIYKFADWFTFRTLSCFVSDSCDSCVCLPSCIASLALIVKTLHRENCGSANRNNVLITARWYRGISD